MEGWFWSLTVFFGPLLVAVAIGYALLRRRRLGPRERQERDAATRKLYKDERN